MATLCTSNYETLIDSSLSRLTNDSKLINKILDDVLNGILNDNNRSDYKRLFRRPNDTVESYTDAVFNHRFKMFVDKYALDYFKQSLIGIDNDTNEYENLSLDTLPDFEIKNHIHSIIDSIINNLIDAKIFTPGVANTNGIPNYELDNIVNSIVLTVIRNQDKIVSRFNKAARNGKPVTYRRIIRDQTLDDMRQGVALGMTPYKEATREMIAEEFTKPNSQLYREVVDKLHREYGIIISKGKLVLEEISEDIEDNMMDDETSAVVFRVGDNMKRDVIKESVTKEFKRTLAKVARVSLGSNDTTYLMKYATPSQIISQLLTKHESDGTIEQMTKTLEILASNNPDFKPIYDMFRNDDIDINEFRNSYYSIMSKANVQDVVIKNGKYRVLNAESIPSMKAYNMFVNSIQNKTVIQQLAQFTIPETDIDRVSFIQNVMNALGFSISEQEASWILTKNPNDRNKDGSYTKTSTIATFENIVNHAKNSISGKGMILQSNLKWTNQVKNVSRLIDAIINTSGFVYNATYANIEGESIQSIRDESYITRLVKPFFRNRQWSNTKLSSADINRDMVIKHYTPYLADPTLRRNMFLYNTTGHGIFTSSGELRTSDPNTLFAISNISRATGIQIGSDDYGTVLKYEDITGIYSDLFFSLYAIAGKFVVPNADSTQGYTVDVASMTKEDLPTLLKTLIYNDIDTFMYGVEQSKLDKHNISRFGSSIKNGKRQLGTAYKFNESSIDIIDNGNIVKITYLDYIRDKFGELTAEMIYDAVYTDPSKAESLYFNETMIQEYANFIIDAVNEKALDINGNTIKTPAKETYDTISELLKTNGSKIEFTSDTDRSFADVYIEQMIWSHFYNIMYQGSQSEYKNGVAVNKRSGQALRTKESLQEFNEPCRVAVIDSVMLQSAVVGALEKHNDGKHISAHHNATDGISYITEDTFEKILKIRGMWNEYKDIFNAKKKGYPVDTATYARMIEQLKHFGYARRPQNVFTPSLVNDNTMVSYQFKDSTKVLFKVDVIGTEMQLVYDWMKEHNIHQLSTKDAVKVGYTKVMKLHNDDGTLNQSALPTVVDDYIINMKYSDYGAQQRVSSHYKDTTSTLGTQLIKKIRDSLALQDAVYPLGSGFVTGNVIYDMIESALSANTAKGELSMIAQLGALDINGNVRRDDNNEIQTDPVKVRAYISKLLVDNGMDRNVSDLLTAKLEIGNVLYSLPLIANTIEDLTLSKFNRILRYTLPGSHTVIDPDIFRKGIDIYDKSLVIDESEYDYRGVIDYNPAFLERVKQRTENNTGSFRLQEEHLDGNLAFEELGTVSKDGVPVQMYKAEIITSVYNSAFFKNATKTVEVEIDGETVIKNVIDFDKIDPKSLEMLGIRIPTDSKGSMIAFEIVGFLRDGSSRTIVPNGLSNRTGWDFDIDSVFNYVRHLTIVDGIITPITKNNAYNELLGSKFEQWLDSIDKSWKSKYIAQLYDDYMDSDNGRAAISQLSQLYDNIGKLDSVYNDIQTLQIQINKGKYPKSLGTLLSNFQNELGIVSQLSKEYRDLHNRLISEDLDTIDNTSGIEQNETLGDMQSFVTSVKRLYNLHLQLVSELSTINPQLANAIDNVISWEYTVIEHENEYEYIYDQHAGKAAIELVERFNKDLSNYIDNHPYKTKFEELERIGDLSADSQAIVDNQIFDAYQSVLLSPYHFNERTRSGESINLFDASKKAIGTLSNDSNVNLFHSRIKNQSANMAIGRLKGISVAFDGTQAILKTGKARLKKGIIESFTNETVEGMTIVLNDKSRHVVESINDSIFIDHLKNMFDNVIIKDDRILVESKVVADNKLGTASYMDNISLISDQTAEISAAVFDAVNREFSTNLNKYTINIFRVLAQTPTATVINDSTNGLYGAMVLIEHPIVKRIVNMAIKKNISMSSAIEQYKQYVIENAIDKGLRSYELTIENEDINILSPTEIQDTYDISNTDINELSIEDRDKRDATEISIVTMLQHYNNIANDFTTISFAIKPEKKIKRSYSISKLKRSITSNIVDLNKITFANIGKLLNDYYTKGLYKDMSTSKLHDILSLSNYKAVTTSYAKIPKELKRRIIADKVELIYAVLSERISTIEDAISFTNDIGYKALSDILSSNIISSEIVDGTELSFIQALYPSLSRDVIKSSNTHAIIPKSIIPSIEANLSVQLLFHDLFSNINIQGKREYVKAVDILAGKFKGIISDVQYRQLSNFIANYFVDMNVNLDTRSIYDVDSIDDTDSIMSINIKNRVLGIIEAPTVEERNAIIRSNSHRAKKAIEYLTIIKNNYRSAFKSLYSSETTGNVFTLDTSKGQIYDDETVAQHITTFETIFKDLFENLPIDDKLHVIRIVFSDIITPAHILDINNLRVINDKHKYSYLRYDSMDKDSIGNHTETFAYMLNSDNIFIRSLAKDMILNNFLINGVNYGKNLGRVLPITYYMGNPDSNALFDDLADNMDMLHPADLLTQMFTKTTSNVDILSNLEDKSYEYFARQNPNSRMIPNLSTVLSSIEYVYRGSKRTLSNDRYFMLNDEFKRLQSDNGFVASGDYPKYNSYYIFHRNELLANKQLLKGKYAKVGDVLFEKYTLQELKELAYANQVLGLRNSSILDDNGTLFKESSEYVVFIPITPLLKNEFSQVSYIRSYNKAIDMLDGRPVYHTPANVAKRFFTDIVDDVIHYHHLRSDLISITKYDNIESTDKILYSEDIESNDEISTSPDMVRIENIESVDDDATEYQIDYIEDAVSNIADKHDKLLNPHYSPNTSDVLKSIAGDLQSYYRLYVDGEFDLYDPTNMLIFIDRIKTAALYASDEVRNIAKQISELESAELYKNNIEEFNTYVEALATGNELITYLQALNQLSPSAISSSNIGLSTVTLNGTKYYIIANEDVYNNASNNNNIPTSISDMIIDVDTYVLKRWEIAKSFLGKQLELYESGKISANRTTLFKTGSSKHNLTKNMVKALYEMDIEVLMNPGTANNLTTNLIRSINKHYTESANNAINKSSNYDNISNIITDIKSAIELVNNDIATIQSHSSQLGSRVLAMQSKVDGLNVSKQAMSFIDGTEVDISMTDLNEYVNRVMYNNRTMKFTNWGINTLGSGFVTTNPIVDSITNQYVIFKSRNNKVEETFKQEFENLLKEYNIDIKDKSLYDSRTGDLIAPYQFYDLKVALFNRSIALRKKFTSSKKFLAALRSANIEFFKSIDINYDNHVIRYTNGKSTPYHEFVFNLINKFTDNGMPNDYTIESLMKDVSSRTKGMYHVVNNEDLLAYKSSISRYNNPNPMYEEILALDQNTMLSIGTGSNKINVYFDINTSNQWESLDESKKDFLTKYYDIIERAYKQFEVKTPYHKGGTPFTYNPNVGESITQWLGWHKKSTYVDSDRVLGNANYNINIDSVLYASKYPTYTTPNTNLIPNDVDMDEYLVEHFKDWYETTKDVLKLDTSIFNMKPEDILNAIEEYKSKVFNANVKYKADNTGYNINESTLFLFDRLSEYKTISDTHNTVNASDVRTAYSDEGIAKAVTRVLKNITRKSSITNNAERAIALSMRLTSLSFMSLNILSGAKNFISGMAHMYEEASKYGFFTAKDLRNATGKFFKHVFPNWKYLLSNSTAKIPSGTNPTDIAMFKAYNDYFQDVNDIVSPEGVKKGLNWLDLVLYSPNTLGEVVMQYSMVSANAKSHRVYNGQILSFADFNMYYLRAALKQILTPSQLRQYNIFEKQQLAKRKSSIKYIPSINDYIHKFVQTLILKGTNDFTKEQAQKLKNLTVDYYDKDGKSQNISIKDLRKKFNELPSLEDSFDINESTGTATIKEIDGKPVVDDQQISLFMRRVAEMNRSIQGSYNRVDKTALQDTIIGELALQFKKWLYPTYARYYGRHFMNNSVNEAAGTVETPIQKPLRDLLAKMFSTANRSYIGMTDAENKQFRRHAKYILKNIYVTLSRLKSYRAALPDYERAALDRSIKTYGITVSMITVATILAGFLADLGDEEDELYTTVAYLMSAISNEWVAVMPVYGAVVEARNMQRSIIASQRVIDQVLQISYYLLKDVFVDEEDESYEDLYYQRGSNKGRHKALVNLEKLIPVYRQIQKHGNMQEHANYYRMHNILLPSITKN